MRYFEEFVTRPEGDEMPKCLGVRVLEHNDENRVLGSGGRKIKIITEPLTLHKGVNIKTYKASKDRPLRLLTMLMKLESK